MKYELNLLKVILLLFLGFGNIVDVCNMYIVLCIGKFGFWVVMLFFVMVINILIIVWMIIVFGIIWYM